MSVRKRASKKSETGYTYQVYFMYIDMYTKERKRYSKSGFLSLEAALLFEKKKKMELDCNLNLIKSLKMTVDDAFQEWLILEAKYNYQDNTVIDYCNRYNKHIKNRLGNVFISEIDYKKLQSYFNDNINIGIRTNYKLKEILNVILNFCIKCNYTDNNPLSLVHVQGTMHHKYKNLIYKEDDFIAIVNEIRNKPTFMRYSFIIALYIGKYTGLRISEVFALDRNDFDFTNQIIFVNKKMVYANLKKSELYVTHQMKTKSSHSILPFHKDLQEILLKWFNYHNYSHVICDKNGNYINPKQLNYLLWKISEKLGVHFHMLRHTLATKLVTSGANMKAVQELLRHSDITTTLNIYTHMNDDSKTKALYQAFSISHNENI